MIAFCAKDIIYSERLIEVLSFYRNFVRDVFSVAIKISQYVSSNGAVYELSLGQPCVAQCNLPPLSEFSDLIRNVINDRVSAQCSLIRWGVEAANVDLLIDKYVAEAAMILNSMQAERSARCNAIFSILEDELLGNGAQQDIDKIFDIVNNFANSQIVLIDVFGFGEPFEWFFVPPFGVDREAWLRARTIIMREMGASEIISEDRFNTLQNIALDFPETIIDLQSRSLASVSGPAGVL